MQHDPKIAGPTPRPFALRRDAESVFTCETGTDCLSSAIQSIAKDLAASGQYTPQICENAQVVLAEVINNIAEHSYSGAPGGQIQIRTKATEEGIQFETLDFGAPMPGLTVPPPALPLIEVPEAELPEGGFGWYLIHTLAPSPQYIRRGNTNILRFVIA